MPPRHQRYAAGEAVGGSHGGHCATDAPTGPNRARLALTVSKSPLWDTGRVTVETAGDAARHGRAHRPAVRHLRARAVLRDPLRILRLQHLHPGRAGRCQPRRLAGRAAHRAGAWPPPACGAAPQVQTVFVGGGTPSLLGGAGSRRCSTRSATTSRSPPTPRSPPRPTRSRRRRSSSPSCAPPGSPGSRWACSRRHRTCSQRWTGCTRRAGARCRAGSPGRGVRPRQPRPHLRNAGGDRRRSAALRRRRHRGRRRPRVRRTR